MKSTQSVDSHVDNDVDLWKKLHEFWICCLIAQIISMGGRCYDEVASSWKIVGCRILETKFNVIARGSLPGAGSH